MNKFSCSVAVDANGIDHGDGADNNVPDEQNQDQERTEHEQRKDQGM